MLVFKQLKLATQRPQSSDHHTTHNNTPPNNLNQTFFDQRSLDRGLAGGGNQEPLRIFTNKAGRKIEARLVSSEGRKVTIARKDGRTFTVSLSSLSEADQNYIATWIAESATEP